MAQESASCGQTSGACLLSSLTLTLGYCLFLTGVVSPSWRKEIGYTYGLWVRCDGDICRYVFAGFTNFMAVVQGGIIVGLLLLTISMLCLLLETCLKSSNSTPAHRARTATVLAATAAMGEILVALTLAFYGYKTVMAIDRLPVLTTGFAVTGVGVIVLLLGSILRVMGPPATWGDGVCCLAPSRRRRQTLLYNTGTQSVGSYYFNPTVADSAAIKAGTSDQKVGLISCFHQKGNAYSSVPSTTSSSLDKGYRHYEEISFDEMPHPPLELLIPPPSPHFQQKSTHGLQHQPYHYTTADFDNNVSSSFLYLQMNDKRQHQQQQQNYTSYQQGTPDCCPPGHVKSFVPQATPRHTKQQRSILRSGSNI